MRVVTFRALLDCGPQSNFITRELGQRFRLTTISTNLAVSGIVMRYLIRNSNAILMLNPSQPNTILNCHVLYWIKLRQIFQRHQLRINKRVISSAKNSSSCNVSSCDNHTKILFHGIVNASGTSYGAFIYVFSTSA